MQNWKHGNEFNSLLSNLTNKLLLGIEIKLSDKKFTVGTKMNDLLNHTKLDLN